MTETLTYDQPKIVDYGSLQVMRAVDPTRTLTLRNRFEREMRKRFRELRGLIWDAIINQDVFGLQDGSITAMVQRRQFDFPRSQDKVSSFMNWLRREQDRGILQIAPGEQFGTSIDSAWTNMYIEDSYKRGVMRARYEMSKAGYKVPTMDETGGIMASMSTPFHMDRVGVLYTRTFSGLKGITEAMDMQISQVLGQGLVDGDGPRLLARKLNAVISGGGAELGITDSLGRFIPAERRARMLARTEIIRAHHQATIQEYQNWAVEGVRVQAEWSTSGFNVCPDCQDLEGQTFPLEEIRDMIPLHPSCRCMALPAKLEDEIRSVEPIKTELPELPEFGTRKQAEDWIKTNIPQIKGITIDSKLSMAEINASLKTVRGLENTGYIKGVNRELNLNLFRAKLTDNVGGSYQMYKHVGTGNFRPTLRIAGNYDQVVSHKIKQRMKPILRERQKIVNELAEVRQRVARGEAIPSGEMTSGMRTMLEQERSRMRGLEQILASDRYDEVRLYQRELSRYFNQAHNLNQAIIHEYGHILNADLQMSAGRYSNEVRGLIRKIKQKNQYRIDNANQLFDVNSHFLDNSVMRYADTVSDYAFTSGSEYFAESWLLFRKGKRLQDADLQRLFELITP